MTAKDFLEIKEYLKETIKLEPRKDLNGDDYIVLLLDNEIVSIVPIQK